MPRQALQPEGVKKPSAPYSSVVVSGDMVWTAGQISREGGDIGAQTRQALASIRKCLEAAGCTMDDVVKVNAFLADLGDFDGYNAVYREFFTEPYPARTSVGAALPPGVLVEIEAVARRPA